MSQKAIQSASFDYNVEAVPSFMQLPDGGYVKNGYLTNRRTDTHEVLGVTSDRYGIIQNSDLINVAEDAFRVKGMTDYKRKVVVTGAGEKMFATYDFRNHTQKLKKGDEVGLRLTVQNSFNGALRASFALGMLRCVCSNGMVALEREVSMTRKHSSGINVDFIGEALEKAVKAWDNSTAVFNRLADVMLTQIEGKNLLANLEKQSVLSGKLRENVETIWDNPRHREDGERNLFNLYNAVTQHLTHDVETERFELSNRVSANVLGVLDRVSRKPDVFAKMILPIELPVAAVSLN